MKEKPKISLCFMCRNRDESELVTIPQMLDSVRKYVDEVCVTVTTKEERPDIEGRLLKMLESYNCKISVYTTQGVILKGQHYISDFAIARNFNMAQATNDIVMWLDADDILVGGESMSEILTNFVDRPVNACWLDYQYAFDKDGNPVVVFPRERIVRKQFYQWVGKLHENLITKYRQMNVKCPSMYVKHNCKNEDIVSKAERNYEVIKMAYDSQKKAFEKDKSFKIDPRIAYDHARSSASLRKHQEAIELYGEFIQTTGSDVDRYDALLRMSDIFLMFGQIPEAKRHIYRAVDLRPQYADAYFRLAKSEYAQENWDLCLHWIATGMTDYEGKEREKPEHLPYDPLQYDFFPKKMASECYFRRDKHDAKKALRLIRECKEICPSDEGLAEAEKRVIKFLNFQRGCDGSLVVLDMLSEEGNEEKIKSYIQSLPDLVKQRREFLELKKKYFPKDPTNRLVIFCERSFEPWNPDSIKTGIGGSEEAVINIAKELKRVGWNVEVYNSCLTEGEWDGVKYIPYDQYDPFADCEVFIAWRMAEYIPLAPKCSLKILWCHDIQSIESFSPELINMIDSIFVLSRFHRTNLPEIEDKKFYITRNGIDPSHFNSEGIIRDMNSYIYASSPDRGLHYVLDMWGKILENNPKAKLHVFYGFTATYKELAKGKEDRHDFKVMIEDMVAKYPDSIIWHDRVGHVELAQWFMKCGYWLYPTDFNEISCITAMKAQASGCVPICTDVGALAETVKYGIVTKGCPPENLEKWVASVNSASESRLSSPDGRLEMSDWAKKNFGWESLAHDWTYFFRVKLNEKKEDTRCQTETV